MKIIKIILSILLFSYSSISFAIDDKKIISNIESYLNSINYLVADFIQIDPVGEEANGKFFLSRPGKLRWQYNPPVPTLIVINGTLLTYYDYDLDQISYVKSEDNLTSFLTKKIIKFDDGVVIKDIQQKDNNTKIAIYKKNKEKEGVLTMIFNSEPIELKKIELIDSLGETTTISLYNMVTNIAVNKELFIVKNPKYFKNKRM